MYKLHYYIFKLFLLVFLSTLLIIILLAISFEFIFNAIDNIGLIWKQAAKSTVLSLELAIPISFLISLCFLNIKISKSFELTVIRALGISRVKLYKPIFYFSILCGLTIYWNQSFLAPLFKAELIKDYKNVAQNWNIEKNKISYFEENYQKAKERFVLFFHNSEEGIYKIENYSENKLQQIFKITDNEVIKENTSSQNTPYFKEQVPTNFTLVNEANFFYLHFTKLFNLAFIQKYNPVFQYIFFQKIADIISVFIIILICMGKLSHPRNSDLESNTLIAICLTLLFIVTNQLGFFIFEAGLANQFFAAFGNSFIWISFIIIREIKNYVIK